MAEFEDSIAHEAHKLVHGARAKDYGHPRFDFSAIAKVWTGLLSDKLLPGAELDPYRVAVLMTGLKLCRLVKSPDHHDSRVDTIGYMLTMERLDEPAVKIEEEPIPLNLLVGRYNPKDIQAMQKFAEEELVRADAAVVEDDDIDDGDYDVHGRPAESLIDAVQRANKIEFSQVNVWFEAGESKYINGEKHTNTEAVGKTICFPFLPGTTVEIKPAGPKFGTPAFDAKAAEVAAEQAKDWPKAQESYDQTLPFQPPGQYFQGDDGREWVKDPTGRWWIFETGQYRRLISRLAPPGWQEVKCPAHGKEMCEACSQPGDLSKCCCGYWEEYGMHWDTCPARNRSFPEHLPRNAQTRIHEVHGGDKDCWCGHRAKDSMPNSKGLIQWDQHSHRGPEPCVPGCPVFDAAKAKNTEQVNNIFEFTGEQVDMQRPGDDRFPH